MKSARPGSIVTSAVLLALALPAVSARSLRAAPAQSDQSSAQSQDALAAAARRVREQQKTQPKPAKVWNNDNIPTSGGVDVIGQTSSPQPPASVNPPAVGSKVSTTKETAANPKKEKSDLEAQLKAAKENLKAAQTDLDFAQRKLTLDQQDFYQNPNYSSNTSGANALQAEQAQIDAKKQAVQAAQDKITGLQGKLAKASDVGSKSADTSAN